jgi:hypothetical protein
MKCIAASTTKLRRRRRNGADFGNHHISSLLYWRLMRDITDPEVLF